MATAATVMSTADQKRSAYQESSSTLTKIPESDLTECAGEQIPDKHVRTKAGRLVGTLLI